MIDTPYSKRELDQLFKTSEEKTLMGLSAVAEQITDLKEHMEILTKPILDQVTKTNGRVSALEQYRDNQKGAVNIAKWIGIPMFGVFVGFMSWLTLQVISISKIVAEELDTRTFEITK